MKYCPDQGRIVQPKKGRNAPPSLPFKRKQGKTRNVTYFTATRAHRTRTGHETARRQTRAKTALTYYIYFTSRSPHRNCTRSIPPLRSSPDINYFPRSAEHPLRALRTRQPTWPLLPIVTHSRRFLNRASQPNDAVPSPDQQQQHNTTERCSNETQNPLPTTKSLPSS